jgi:hypothetical protein
MIMPFLSCLVLSHDKAAYVGEAIGSLIAQTFGDWEAVVFDSGTLYDRGFFDRLPAAKGPRVRVVRSWETEELRKTKTIASWCFNECFRTGLVRGEYVTYLCDDDLFYPNAFQEYFDHARANPHVMAMYGSIDLTGLSAGGEKFVLGQLVAEEVKGSCCGGGALDGQVDYLQVCHRAEVLSGFPDDEYWPESREVISHADGIFLEKIGSRVPIHPVRAKVGQNRKVPLSLNDGGQALVRLQQLARLQQELADLRGCLRYQIADRVNDALRRVPLVHAAGKKLVLAARRAWRLARGQRDGARPPVVR